MNKYFTIFLFFIFCHDQLEAQKSIKHVVQQLKKTENYKGFSIPGWLMTFGLRIIAKNDTEIEDSGIQRVLKNVKSLRVATTTLDITKFNPTAIVNNFMKSIKAKDSFDEYVSIRTEDKNLKILIQENKEFIKNIVILSAEKGDISVIHLKTNISVQDLKDISFNEIKKDTQNIKIDIQ